VQLSLPDRAEVVAGGLRDISVGGVFVRCSAGSFELGMICRMEVVLYEPGDPINLWLEGEVVRKERHGIALQITRIYQERFEQLHELLSMGF